jgi:hypothetical protein
MDQEHANQNGLGAKSCEALQLKFVENRVQIVDFSQYTLTRWDWWIILQVVMDLFHHPLKEQPESSRIISSREHRFVDGSLQHPSTCQVHDIHGVEPSFHN